MEKIETQSVAMPRLGFGTVRMPGGGCQPVVESAMARSISGISKDSPLKRFAQATSDAHGFAIRLQRTWKPVAFYGDPSAG
jgi:hypothetical protein